MSRLKESDMKKNRASILAAALIAVLAVFPACSLKTVKTETLGNPEAMKRVLIAYDHSAFKAKAASEAAALLASEGFSVTLTDVGRLLEQDSEKFGAVVLMAPLVAWRMDENVRAFIAKTPERDKIVLVTTAGGPDWKADIEGVDAVTEASVMENADTLAHTIAGKAKALIDEK